MAWPNGQGWEVELTVPHAQVPGSGTHADFPVLLTRANLPDEMFDPSGNHCQTDGGDIRAGTASDMGTQLPLEVVGTITLDSASGSGTGKAEIWVKRDLNTTTDTTFWLAWNTAGTTAKESDSGTFGRDAVWDGYGAVWHFEETATPYADSTGNGHDLADVTGTSVDGAGRFTGGGASVDLTSGAQIEAPSAPDGRYMHTVWLKMNPLTAFTPLLRRQQSSFNQYHWLDTDSAAGGYRVEATRRVGATVQADLGETMPFDTWAYAVGRFDATTIEAILDGVSAAALTATEITPFTPNRTYSRPYALLDEARIRPSVNIDYLDAERANQSDPAAFVSPGTPATVGGGGTTVNATSDSLTLTEYNPSISINVGVSATSDSLTLTEYSATVSTTTDVTVDATSDSLTLTEYAATVSSGALIEATTDSLTLTEYPASLTIDVNISAGTQVLSFIEYPASINTGANKGGFGVDYSSAYLRRLRYQQGLAKDDDEVLAIILASGVLRRQV